VFNTTEENPLSDISAADPAKWNARYAGVRYVGNSLMNYGFNLIYVVMGAPSDDAGANEVNYTNAPSDISDALGRQLPAFSGFPL
jgi:hypothetical protein